MPSLLKFSAHGSVAQLVEQGTHNPLVEGSSPSRPTNTFNDLEKFSKQPICERVEIV